MPFQYEQMQAQMKDDETLEKLRQDARKAELAYQAAQLANAETLKKAQEDWMRELQGIKDGGVLDKWIEFFNSVRAGPPEGRPAAGLSAPGRRTWWRTRSGTIRPQHAGTIIPNHELGIAQDLRAAQGSQPVIVNFVLDGEVVMSAVVKPERLRPVVEEINRTRQATMTMSIAGKITIDGKDYKVLAPDYERSFEPPKTVRRGVLGNTHRLDRPRRCRQINAARCCSFLCASHRLMGQPERSCKLPPRRRRCPTPTTSPATQASGDRERTTSRS